MIKYETIQQKNIDYFYKKIIFPQDLINDCWLTTYVGRSDGYFTVCFNYKSELGHRFSYMIHNQKNIDSNMMICHKCNNKKCVNPNHLYEGTREDNTLDAINNNSFKKGEEHFNSKFTKQEIFKILDIIFNNNFKTQSEIASFCNITKFNVYSILNKKLWKDEIEEYCKIHNCNIQDIKNKVTLKRVDDQTKQLIINDLKSGISVSKCADKYNFGLTTIRRIQKNI